MRETVITNRWVTSPRACAPGRTRSTREVYHPAVQDLSEQAARNGAPHPEESILSVVSTCTPRHSRPGSETYHEKFASSTPVATQYNAEEIIKSSPTTQLCFNSHNTEYLEDLHRQRVLVSAHQRRKLHSQRRSRSTPLTAASMNGSASDVKTHNKNNHRNSWQGTDEEAKLELVVTNGKPDESDVKERINYRLTMRTKPKSAHGNLRAGGTPLPLLNGYNQTLLQTHPKYSQQYCRWLTNGLKIQSFQFNNPLREYSHAKPPPPLLQYINRPKPSVSLNVGGARWATNRAKIVADFNIVGVQKEVQTFDGSSTQANDKDADKQTSAE